MSNDWYYQVMGNQVGPLSAAQLKRLAENGTITPDTHVMKGESGRWMPATNVKGLFLPLVPPSPLKQQAPVEAFQDVLSSTSENLTLCDTASAINAVEDLAGQQPHVSTEHVAPPSTTESTLRRMTAVLSTIRLVTILGFLAVTALVAAVMAGVVSKARYEYLVVTQTASGTYSRTGIGALSPTTIELSEKELDCLGDQGWELVTSFVEVETAFPNFGKDEYVTGLRENVRPQRAVLVFKRQRPWF